VTHPVLSGKAVENISQSSLDELIVTDTIPLREDAKGCKKIRQLKISSMLAETIRRVSNEESVSSLYVD
jgi:ribose-phosphate pyrophosphokinase